MFEMVILENGQNHYEQTPNNSITCNIPFIVNRVEKPTAQEQEQKQEQEQETRAV